MVTSKLTGIFDVTLTADFTSSIDTHYRDGKNEHNEKRYGHEDKLNEFYEEQNDQDYEKEFIDSFEHHRGDFKKMKTIMTITIKINTIKVNTTRMTNITRIRMETQNQNILHMNHLTNHLMNHLINHLMNHLTILHMNHLTTHHTTHHMIHTTQTIIMEVPRRT